jgi:hypothetical protein
MNCGEIFVHDGSRKLIIPIGDFPQHTAPRSLIAARILPHEGDPVMTDSRPNALRRFLVFSLASLALAAPGALAQESFRATHAASLEASEEPSGFDDPIAGGVAIFRLDRETNTLEYRVSVAGLDSIVGAHVHRAPAGEDGPVVFPLAITDAMHTASGMQTGLSPSFIDSLTSGLAYVNVHTRMHPSGHIRGQIQEIPNAAAPAMNTTQEPHEVFSDSGTGTAILYIDEATRSARYTISWSSLTGRATMAHFHIAPPASSGPPVHTIEIPADSTVMTTSGTWQMTPEQLDALKAGMIYANVHTQVNPAGEVRGIVVPADFYSASITAVNAGHGDASNANGTATGFLFRSPFAGLVFLSSVVDETTTPIMMAHIHRGAAGQDGGVVVPLDSGFSSDTWGTAGGAVLVDDIPTFASSGMYVNYHTGTFQAGEARGQLIPGANNLSMQTSAAPLASEVAPTMTARHDRASGAISLRLPESARRDGVVELYSALGERMASVAADGPTVRIDGASLPTGAYFARLVQHGRITATARIAVN